MVSFTSSSVVDSICPQGQEQIAQELNLLNGPWTLRSPALSRSGTFEVSSSKLPWHIFSRGICKGIRMSVYTNLLQWLNRDYWATQQGGFKNSSVHAEGKLISLDKTMFHCLAWFLNDKHKTGQMFHSVLPWLCPCKSPLFTLRLTRSFQLPFFSWVIFSFQSRNEISPQEL